MKFYTNVTIRGNKILLRGFEDGHRVQRDVEYSPFVFRTTYNKKNTGYTTLDGKPVEKINFDSLNDMQSYMQESHGVDNIHLHGMTKYRDQVYPFINEYYPDEIQYDASLINIVYLDIEVAADQGFPNIEKADKPITAITIKCRDNYYVFGCGDYLPTSKNIHYMRCRDELDLCRKFVAYWESPTVDPDIVSGWNVEMFDIPYLVNRITRIFGDGGKTASKLSPWRSIKDNVIKSKTLKGKEVKTKILQGITILDYLALYKKFTYSDTEMYTLNHIAHIELGEKKVDYSQYESLQDLYVKDHQKFIEYNVHDVTLVSKLDDKMKLIDQVLAIAYDAKVDYIDTLRTVRMWDMIIHNHLINRNVVVPLGPSSAAAEKDEPIKGAYVKDPLVGMHNYIVSFDLTSLYPSLIMQYNISPDTKVHKIDLTPEDCLTNSEIYQQAYQYAVDNDLTLCANGTMYRKDRYGFLPELMEKVFADRKRYKNLMLEAKQTYEQSKSVEDERKYIQYNNMQLAKKIQLNSCYGALSNIYFRFFDTDLAEAITQSGQVSIRWMENRINEFLNKSLSTTNQDYVIAVDTDSLYITLDKFVDKVYNGNLPTKDKILKMLDKACDEIIQPLIEKEYDKLAKHMLVYHQRMQMKRECIADKGIWVAKKRYILNVYNQEGVQYQEPKLKMMGIEAVKSSTPAVCKRAIKDVLHLVMNGTKEQVFDYIHNFKDEFYSLPFEDVAFPRSCQGVTSYALGDKSIPIHVRGALVYNSSIQKMDLQNKYNSVQDGEKIKFSYLRMPNPVSSNVISAPGPLPKQLGLDKYIDYGKQFEKSFEEPLNAIIGKLGWSVSQQQTIEDLFG